MSLVIDIAIIAALLAAVGYGFILSQRLTKLMRILRDLEPAITAFSMAVDKSESSATGLRAAAIRLAEEVGQAKGSAPASRPTQTRALPARRTAEPEKTDMVRSFFDTLHARNPS